MATTITDVDGLQAMNDGLDGDYILGGDIDAAATSTWNLGSGFIPIGYIAAFTGTFDGKGYTISDLFESRDGANNIGLFAETDGATISNVILADFDITGEDDTGALIGYSTDTTVSNVAVTGGSVTGDGYVGGLIGFDYGSIVSDCYTTCTVEGNSCVGGVFGYSYQTDTDDCYATGAVTGTSSSSANAGGLAGESYNSTFDDSYATGAVTLSDSGHPYDAGGFISEDDSSTFTKCYATGAVSGNYNIGGFGGDLDTSTVSKCYATGNVTGTGTANAAQAGGFVGKLTDATATITDCYARGDVDCSGVDDFDLVGGFVGELASGTITNCYSTGAPAGDDDVGGFCGANSGTIATSYWDTDTSGTETTDGGTGKTTTLMMLEATYSGWDFCAIWNINLCINDGYPYFRWEYDQETRTLPIGPIFDPKGRIPKGARVRAIRADTGAVITASETTLDANGKSTITGLPNDVAVSVQINWGGSASGDNWVWLDSRIIGITEGGTGASDAPNARSSLGLGAEDSPEFTAIELGHASDSTIARSAAGRATIEGVNLVRGPASATDNRLVKTNGTTGDLIQQTGITADDDNNVSGVAKLTTTSDIELGNASDTTLHRVSAGLISVEGSNLIRASDVDDTPVDDQTAVPVSSNWAYDHAAATPSASVHPISANVDFNLYQATDLVVMTVANEAALPTEGIGVGQLCFATSELTLHICTATS